jgi:hypothetical protein
VHKPGAPCSMTESSDDLAEYRLLLLTRDDTGPWAKRVRLARRRLSGYADGLHTQAEAIQSIEETLYRRGDIAKIQGQPLHLISPEVLAKPPPAKPKAPRPAASTSTSAAKAKPAIPHRKGAAERLRAYEAATACAACGAAPFHAPEQCPLVAQGAARYVCTCCCCWGALG